MTRSMYNATAQGFNQNGLVIVQLNDGSFSTARQTGNGVLGIGQPIVYQASSSPGVANVCYDPAALPVETRRWPVEAEEVSDEEFDYAYDRDYFLITNDFNEPPSLANYNSLTSIAAGSAKWGKISLDRLLRFGNMAQNGPWTYAYDPMNFYDNEQTVLTLGDDRTVLILRARRRLRVKTISASSNFQPGGSQSDPSRSGRGTTPPYTQQNVEDHYFEVAVVRAGIETTAVNNAILYSLGTLLYNYALNGGPSYTPWGGSLTGFSNSFLAAEPYRLKTVAQFIRPAPPVNTNEKLKYRANIHVNDQLLAKGDLLILYASCGYYFWQPGNVPWKLTGLEVS